MSEAEILENVLSVIDNYTKKRELFLSVQNKAALEFKNSTKRLYDFTREQSQRNTNALPELVTEGFDEEQIWQQLELQNEGELTHFITGVSRVLAESKKLALPVSTTKPEIVHSNEETAEDNEEEEEIMSEEDALDSEMELENASKRQKRDTNKQRKKPSIVDDKFFKLQELDEYLNKEERKEVQNEKNEQRDSDEESVDLFNDFSDDEESKSGEEKLLKYTDFFDSPQSEDEEAKDSIQYKNADSEDVDDDSLRDDSDEAMNTDEEEDERKSSKKKVTFNLTNDSDDTDSIENKSDNRKEDVEIKSSLETRQERLQERIQQLEREAVAEKPWQLKGEVSATNRPQNSLLEEFVEFDITTRPAPVITEQTTVKLEDIIKQRIKDKAWDDVEKKFKPVETPMEYKKKLVLNQEKSKESLSQIYENEYLKQKQALNPDNQEKEEEEPKLHTEIREMMHSVFLKLDALSNFHYTPKPINPEIKIISNIPAINMEEVAPVAVSDAALLAPEEIKEKQRGDLMDRAERSKTDMKRERRHKKMKQRARHEAMEKKEKLNAMKPGITKKYKKDKATELTKKLINNRNIVKMDETGQRVPKSSTAFFNQLQDQVKSHIKSKTDAHSKKKQKDALSAIKLKL